MGVFIAQIAVDLPIMLRFLHSPGRVNRFELRWPSLLNIEHGGQSRHLKQLG